jgi:hypothetical protein
VVTAHLINEIGQPTIAARDEILAFFASRLEREYGALAVGTTLAQRGGLARRDG